MAENGNIIQITYPILYCIIFVTSVVGNSCFLAAVRKKVELQTPVNILLCNVAISDLLFTVLTVTHCVEEVVGEWPFTDVFCRINYVFIEVSYTVSIATLTAISIKKYLIMSRKEIPRNREVYRPLKTYIKIFQII